MNYSIFFRKLDAKQAKALNQVIVELQWKGYPVAWMLVPKDETQKTPVPQLLIIKE